MNILHTCFSRSWGGLEMHTLIEASRLSGRGNPLWLAVYPGSRLAQEATGKGLRVLPLEVKGYFHPAEVIRLRAFLRREQIAIIHCQHSKDLATVVPAMRISGRKIPILLSKRVGSYIMKRDPLHRFTYRHVSKVLAISEVIRRNVIETTPMRPDDVITVHHGIDTSEFRPDHARRQEVRKELGMIDDQILIGFVGRFSRGKGHEEFLKAAEILVRRYTQVRFAIVGEASYGEEEEERRIRALCATLRLDSVVNFTGFRRDIRDVMAAFDVFAFPSHAEAFGAVLIEAMALERPVVSTNCDGVLDIVTDGETGLFVNPGRADQLAGALARMIDDPALRVRLGRNGRLRVLERFDERLLIAKIERIYEGLLQHSPREVA